MYAWQSCGLETIIFPRFEAPGKMGKKGVSMDFQMLRKSLTFLVAAVGLLLLCQPVFAQGTQGRILGTITDQSGGVIAGATVTVTDVQRGIPRALTTDQSGEYVAPSLLPGTYTVRAETKGFKTVERANLLLEVATNRPRRWKPRTPL